MNETHLRGASFSGFAFNFGLCGFGGVFNMRRTVRWNRSSAPGSVSMSSGFSNSGLGFLAMYRLYIDETGNADLQSSHDPNHRYLSLTGIIMHLDHVRDVAVPRLESLKHEVFGTDPDNPLILHRKDLINKNYPFNALRDTNKEAQFNAGLLDLLNNLTCRVITVVIDKHAHHTQYGTWHYDPYHYCLEILLERYALIMQAAGSSGDVIAEARGGKPDRRLENCYAYLYKNGGSFIGSETFQARLSSKSLKMKRKEANIAGLQIADLLAHPSARYVRSEYSSADPPTGFPKEIVDILIHRKYHRWNGRIHGRGIKWLPK